MTLGYIRSRGVMLPLSNPSWKLGNALCQGQPSRTQKSRKWMETLRGRGKRRMLIPTPRRHTMFISDLTYPLVRTSKALRGPYPNELIRRRTLGIVRPHV